MLQNTSTKGSWDYNSGTIPNEVIFGVDIIPKFSAGTQRIEESIVVIGKSCPDSLKELTVGKVLTGCLPNIIQCYITRLPGIFMFSVRYMVLLVG